MSQSRIKIFSPRLLLTLISGMTAICAFNQSNTYWTRSFNEESSLLSGAVVGGGAGPTAIYYNPAGISEVQASKLSINASLFSFDFNNIKNALGEDINIKTSNGTVEPRFISYMIKSKRFKNWSFEVAFLNNENSRSEITESVNNKIDVLKGIEGEERYFAFYQQSLQFKDDWIGAGGSVRLSEHWSAGASMFVTIKSLRYSESIQIEAYSLNDSIFLNGHYVPFYIASYENSEYLKFNDYRLTWKAGFMYENEKISVGVNLTTPSLGGIYSDGKRNSRKTTQSNITNPDYGMRIPDYIVEDYKEKGDMQVGYKTPFSVSAGFIIHSPGKSRTFYTSVEYFFGIDAYRMVEAEESPEIGAGNEPGDVLHNEWLTYVSGNRPVFNAAFGYSWTLKKNLLLMGGARTDFNYINNLDFGSFTGFNTTRSFVANLYHLTCGLSWKIFGQDIITGAQYTLGYNKNQGQIANLSDPVEYIPQENLALQGIPTNTVMSWFNSVSLYFGASFNFGDDKK
jgi:hypothetical protein